MGSDPVIGEKYNQKLQDRSFRSAFRQAQAHWDWWQQAMLADDEDKAWYHASALIRYVVDSMHASGMDPTLDPKNWHQGEE